MSIESIKTATKLAYEGNVSEFREMINCILGSKLKDSINSVKSEISKDYMVSEAASKQDEDFEDDEEEVIE